MVVVVVGLVVTVAATGRRCGVCAYACVHMTGQKQHDIVHNACGNTQQHHNGAAATGDWQQQCHNACLLLVRCTSVSELFCCGAAQASRRGGGLGCHEGPHLCAFIRPASCTLSLACPPCEPVG